MVGVGGGEVVLRITGVQKTIKGEGENLACGHPLIHRGEEGTKSGYKKTKRDIKILACGQGLTLFLSNRVRVTCKNVPRLILRI